MNTNNYFIITLKDITKDMNLSGHHITLDITVSQSRLGSVRSRQRR